MMNFIIAGLLTQIVKSIYDGFLIFLGDELNYKMNPKTCELKHNHYIQVHYAIVAVNATIFQFVIAA